MVGIVQMSQQVNIAKYILHDSTAITSNKTGIKGGDYKLLSTYNVVCNHLSLLLIPASGTHVFKSELAQ